MENLNKTLTTFCEKVVNETTQTKVVRGDGSEMFSMYKTCHPEKLIFEQVDDIVSAQPENIKITWTENSFCTKNDGIIPTHEHHEKLSSNYGKQITSGNGISTHGMGDTISLLSARPITKELVTLDTTVWYNGKISKSHRSANSSEEKIYNKFEENLGSTDEPNHIEKKFSDICMNNFKSKDSEITALTVTRMSPYIEKNKIKSLLIQGEKIEKPIDLLYTSSDSPLIKRKNIDDSIDMNGHMINVKVHMIYFKDFIKVRNKMNDNANFYDKVLDVAKSSGVFIKCGDVYAVMGNYGISEVTNSWNFIGQRDVNNTKHGYRVIFDFENNDYTKKLIFSESADKNSVSGNLGDITDIYGEKPFESLVNEINSTLHAWQTEWNNRDKQGKEDEKNAFKNSPCMKEISLFLQNKAKTDPDVKKFENKRIKDFL